MTQRLETASEMALRMPRRWGLAEGAALLDFHRGLSAVLLDAMPAEVCSEAGDAHIVCLPMGQEARHRIWHDDRAVHDGFLPAHRVTIVRSGTRPRAVLQKRYRVLHVFVPASEVVASAERAGAGDAARALEIEDPRFAADPALETILRQIAEAIAANSWTDRLWLDTLGASLIARLLQRWSNLSSSGTVSCTGKRPGAYDWRVRHAVEFLESRIEQGVTLSELGDAVGLSDSHTMALFRERLGVPPHRWLMRRRVQRACQMLTDTGESITEIAHACGFASSQHLAFQFRRQMGVTPTQFRRDRLS